MTLRAASIGIITLLTTAPVVVAEAASRSGVCAGVLHRDSDALRIGGGKGEDEGICLVGGKADMDKVLAVCSLEHHCWIKGRVSDCKDSGECSAITGITNVRKK